MEPLVAIARESALHVLEGGPVPEGFPPHLLTAAQKGLAQALADAMSVGRDLSLIQEAAEAARRSYSHARKVAFAALAAQHNASDGPDGPRLLPLCLELQVAIVNKAYSDR